MWFLLLTWLGCTNPPATPAGPPPAVPVKVETLQHAPLDQAIEAVGQVQTVDSVEIRPETGGLVERVRFTDGARVRRGDVLVELRDAEARANLLDATARQKLAKIDLKRATALFQHGDVARAEVDRAEANADLARAAVERAKESLRRTTIVAPLDGVLGRRDVTPGQLVDPTQTLTRLEVVDPIFVEASFPETAVGRIVVGQPARVTVEGRAPFDGTVSFAGPRLEPVVRTLPVRIAIANADGALVPGMTARVRILTEQRPSALMVPSHAVSPSARGPAVWVVTADQKAELKPVKLGERLEARVEVVEGLAAGDTVVVEGLARLRPGAAVKVSP